MTTPASLQGAVNLIHRSNRISYMLQRVCEDECSDLTGSEGQRVDVLNPIHVRPRLHIASDVSFTRKNRTKISDRFLTRDLKSSDLDDRLGTRQGSAHRAGEIQVSAVASFLNLRGLS